MDYGILKEFQRMTPRECWKWARNALAIQRTAWDFKRGIAACFYRLNFEEVRFCADEYGMLYGPWGEKYVFVKRHKGDRHGYRVSRFGVKRVLDWNEMD